MLTRIALFAGLLAVLIGGGFALFVARTPVEPAQPQTPPAVETPAVAAREQPAAPALPGDNSQPDTRPAQAPAPQPYVIEPTAPTPEPPAATAPSSPPVIAAPPAAPTPTPPVVTAPAPEPQAPVVVAPAPAPSPSPVIVTPTPLPDKPVIAEPKPETKPDAKPDAKAASAKALFAAEKLPTLGKAMAIGYYPRGCLQGAVSLPVNGQSWQVMRVSRNRNWGHPSLVRFLEKFAPAAAKSTGWKGILVGDMSQPRGGPTPYGHASHQTGLDVDIWFMPMPGHVLSSEEREKTSAINLVADDWKRVNPKTWTPQHATFIKTAAEQPNVERVLVNAAIKKEMCRMNGNRKEPWMAKVRPWYAHHDHIHVRLKCPEDSPACRGQPSVTDDEENGCTDKALDHWFSDKVLNPPKPTTPPKPPKPLTMADFPPACQSVLAAPARAQN